MDATLTQRTTRGKEKRASEPSQLKELCDYMQMRRERERGREKTPFNGPLSHFRWYNGLRGKQLTRVPFLPSDTGYTNTHTHGVRERELFLFLTHYSVTVY